MREIFPSEDFDLHDDKGYGEDPLSPALRDIERERAGEGGREREICQNCTRHTKVTPSLCGMLV